MHVGRKITYLALALTFGVIVYYFGIQLVARQVTIQVEMESASSDVCQMFYNSGFGFSEKRSLKKSIGSTNSRQTLEFQIPRGRVTQVRIDPGFQTDSVTIHNVILQIDTIKTILPGKEILSWATIANIDVTTLTSGAVTCKPNTSPRDMQIVLNSSLFTENPAILMQDILLISGLALLAGLSLFLVLFYYQHDVEVFFKTTVSAVRNENLYTRLSQGLIRWIGESTSLILLSVMVVFFSYGYELTSFSLSMDEELEALENFVPSIAYVSLSRYGIFLLKSLTDNIHVLPYIPFAISLLLLAFTNVMLIKLSRLTFSSSVIFTLLFLSSPVFSYYLLFNTLNAQVSFGLFLVSLAYVFNHRIFLQWCDQNLTDQPEMKKQFYILSIVLTAFAFSIYQAIMIFSIVVFLFLQLTEWIQHPGLTNQKRILLECKEEIIRSGLALFLYKTGDIFFKYTYGTEAEKYTSHQYLDVFIHWPEKSIREITGTLMSFILYLYDKQTLFGGLSTSYVYIPISGLILYGFFKFRKKFHWSIILFILGLAMAPLFLTILLGGPLPLRTYFSFPVMVAGFWGIFHSIAKGWVRGFIFLVSIFFFIHQSYTITNLFYKDHLSSEANKAFIFNLSQSIRNLSWQPAQKEFNVVIAGALKLNSFHRIYSSAEIHGISSLIYGQAKRYNNLFLLYGQTDFFIQELGHSNLLPCEQEGMPVWPAPGSVRLVGNTALVKLSETYQYNE